MVLLKVNENQSEKIINDTEPRLRLARVYNWKIINT